MTSIRPPPWLSGGTKNSLNLCVGRFKATTRYMRARSASFGRTVSFPPPMGLVRPA